MRQKNWRLVIFGFVLIIAAVGFYFFMLTLAPQSTDPVALARMVGQVSGVVIGVSTVLIIVGLIGKKA